MQLCLSYGLRVTCTKIGLVTDHMNELHQIKHTVNSNASARPMTHTIFVSRAPILLLQFGTYVSIIILFKGHINLHVCNCGVTDYYQ